jgi:hypothetical protein
MTNGGHTMTEGWNLQLQGRVRELEADLAEAEKHLRAVLDNMRSPAHWTLADGFLKKMAAKRECAAAQAKAIDAFLEKESVDAARDGTNPSAGLHPTSSDVERMRDALEWYGEQARLARLIHSEGDAGRHALAEDGGKRARAILAERSAARSEPISPERRRGLLRISAELRKLHAAQEVPGKDLWNIGYQKGINDALGIIGRSIPPSSEGGSPR